MNGRYGKRIIAALRAVLLCGGVLLGSSLAALFFESHSDIASGQVQLAVIIVSGLVPGLFLMLSARSIAALILAIGVKIAGAIKTKKAEEIVGYALGIALGLIMTFVLYIILTVTLPLPPLNIAITVIAALLFCIVGAQVCSRAFIAAGQQLIKDDDDREEKTESFVGYVLTSSAFFHAKTEKVVGKWLCGKLYMLEETAELFTAADDESAGRAMKLLSALSDKIRRINYSKYGDEKKDVFAFASARRLAVIVSSRTVADEYPAEIPLLCLDEL